MRNFLKTASLFLILLSIVSFLVLSVFKLQTIKTNSKYVDNNVSYYQQHYQV